MGRRAESLADRVEEGATGLAAFAEGLPEAERRAPASRSDGRSSRQRRQSCPLLTFGRASE
jgi:hypothetical protein